MLSRVYGSVSLTQARVYGSVSLTQARVYGSVSLTQARDGSAWVRLLLDIYK